MSEINKLREAMAVDLPAVKAAIERWEAINRRGLADEIAEHNAARGLWPSRAEVHATSDAHAAKKTLAAFRDVHAWLATLDNNLSQEKIID